MRERTNRSKIRAGVFAAVLLGLGVPAVFLLAGGESAPRQDAGVAAIGDPPATSTAVTPQPATPSPAVTTTAPAVASPAPAGGTARPAVPPRPPSTPAAARPTAGSLAGAWIAAGAQGVDPDATPGPLTISGSGGPPPVRIEIPGIGVSAPIDAVGLNQDGTLKVPADFARTNYYTGRPVPGDPGPAIIVGHVDNRRGPAVFYRLRELQPGGEVVVHRADGSQVGFVVERSRQVPKNAFPTEEVYGATPDPTLRLITCGGTFDRRSGHYRDNIVVFLRARA